MLAHRLKAFLFLILTTCFANAAQAEPLHWDERVRRGALQNGLQYLIYDSAKEDEPFNIRLIVHAGSVDEDTPSGVAHSVEHMVFQRTKAHPESIYRYITDLGWRQGVQINALTRASETQFMIRTRPNDSLDLNAALALLADMAFGATFAPADWDKERNVILEEMRQGDGVAARVSALKKQITRAGSRYVDRPTIGTREGVEALTVDDLRQFYTRFYRASNMTLILSGNIDQNAASAAIAAAFAQAPTHPAPNRPYVALPLSEHMAIGMVQDPEGTTSRVALGWQLAMPQRDSAEGLYPYFQNYFISRLIREALHARQSLYAPEVESLSVMFRETTRERLTIAFAARSAQHDTALKHLLREIERLKQGGFSEAEFVRLCEKMRVTATQNVEAAAARDYRMWEDKMTTAVLQSGVLETPEAKARRTLRWLETVTVAELNARFREMLTAESRFVYYQVPGQVPPVTLPNAQQIRAMQSDFAREDMLATLAATPQPAPIDLPEPVRPVLPEYSVASAPQTLAPDRSPTPEINEWDLANGDRVIWLNRPTPDGQLYIRGQSRPGYNTTTTAPWASQAAVQLWMQSGFDFWTEAENAAWQDLTRDSWSVQLQDDQLDIAAVTTAEALPERLEIYGFHILHGQVTPAGVAAFADQLSAENARELGASARLSKAMQNMTYAPFEQPPAELETDAAEFRTLAQQHLHHPVQWFIIGPAQPDHIAKAFATRIGNLPRSIKLTAEPLTLIPREASAHLRLFDTPRATVQIRFHRAMTWSPERAFVVSTLTPMGQTALKTELRHRLGGIYRLNFEMSLDPGVNAVIGTLEFDCAPERAEALATAARRVLRGLPEVAQRADIARLRDDIHYAEAGRLTDPNTWLRRLALSYRRYNDPRYLSSMTRLGTEMTAELLTQTAREIVDFDGLFTVIGGPK